MLTLYLLTCVCLAVAVRVPLSDEEGHVNGETGWYLPFPDGSFQWVDMKTVEAIQSYYNAIDELEDAPEDREATTFEPAFSEEATEARTNGVDGWYVPFADGSLKWLNMDDITRIQTYENDLVNSANSPQHIEDDFYAAAKLKDDPVKFWLQHSNEAELISPTDDIHKAGFNLEHTTIFVAQTFLATKDSLNFNTTLWNAFAKKGGSYNFISIEWLSYFEFNYIGATVQVPIVGEHVAHLFDTLVQSYKMDCEKTHLIGHGLGAHVVGFAAKNIKSCKVPRITSLDPALALFPYDEPAKRLNSTDARCVESIQTDGGFFGHEQPIGSAAFYCNGGKQQTGCSKNNACHHERAIKIFAKAIESNNFPSTKCADFVSAANGGCVKWDSEVYANDVNNSDTEAR